MNILDSNFHFYLWMFIEVIERIFNHFIIIQMAVTRVFVILLLAVSIICNYQAPLYAEWAHSHVVWINRNLVHDQQLYDLVKTYQKYDIPVGGVNIDSTWSECINNFKFDKKKFPHPEQIAPYFHAQDIKVILWATSVVNKECPEYEEGKSKGYFLNGGKTIHWWHGEGAFVDFFNPAAKQWFQGLMDRVIDLGFDGWKCDGTDPMIELLRPMPYSAALKRYVSYREYSNQYYGTFYNYTKSKNPNALIMSRPVDSFKSIAFLGYAPKYVMFSGWVGDQNNTVQGFTAAMVNVIHSASRGYLNFGFDIGGYKQKQPSQKWLFLRWMQIGSLLPFMENGGNGKHYPWLYDNQTINIYRKFVLLHYDLKAFFLTAASEAYSKHQSVVQPLIKDKRVIELQNPSNLGYVLWNTFLVAPIFQENGYAQIIFPKGYKWMYYFNHNVVFDGTGAKQSLGFKLDQTALFVRSNSIVPIGKELWLVYLSPGVHSKQIIAGAYSDEIQIDLSEGQMKINVQRFYKSQQIKAERILQNTLKLRIIGISKSLYQINDKTLTPLRETQYENQSYVEIEFSRPRTLYFDVPKQEVAQ